LSPSPSVNTVAFVKDTEPDFIDLMEKVAKETGGTFRKVAVDELKL
jgi:hypothetical protein